MQERRHATSPDGDKDRDALLIDLLEEGQEIVLNLRHLQLRPHPCYRDGNHVEPVNLYHKVGHGKLDMYIISPAKDNRDIKEFLSKWNANDPKLFGGRKEGASLKDFHFPLQNLVSICALLVWQPANPNDTITRILFPGSTPQHKIFEGLDKLKHLEFLKYPVCTARSISPSASTVGITSRASSKIRSAPAVIDKLLPGEGVKTSKPSEINKQVAKTATIPVAGSLPDVKQTKPSTTTAPTSAPVPPPSKAPPQTKQKVDKLTSKTEPPKMKTETNKSLDSEKTSAKPEKATKAATSETAKPKVESKARTEPRTSITKSKIDSKPPRSTERKSQKPPPEKKSESAKSSPTTPKKSVEAKMNGVVSKAETAKLTRTSSRTRPSPTATPAKSTKEANNRKVVESKYQHVSRVSSSRASTTKTTKKDQQESSTTTTKAERKPISRRPKPASPSKASAAGKSPSSPAKSSSAKSTPTPSVKSDKDGVIRKVKGEADKITTDSSAVSTPSTVEPETAALKIKPAEAETPETPPVSELKVEKEEVALEKEVIEETAKPDLQETVEKEEIETDKVVAEEEEIVKKTAVTVEQSKEETMPQEMKDITKGPSVETEAEQEAGEEDVTEDKESEAIGEEILQEKDIVNEKEDIEVTEEERTEDMEEDEVEEPEEQQTEIKKSLADELELEVKHGRKTEEGEDEEDEEDEYLIIEKEEVEQYMEDSLQEQESVESHMPEEADKKLLGPEDDEEEDEEEGEGELQKHLRDEVESEKEKKHETEKEFVKVNGFPEDTKDIISKEDTELIKENKSSPIKEDKISGATLQEKADEKEIEKEKETEKEEIPEQKELAEATVTITEEEQKEATLVSKEITAETKEQLQEEVQEIITSAKEIVKTKRESETKLEELGEANILDQKDIPEEEKKDTEEGDEIKEGSSISPEEKLDISSEKNREITDDTRDTDQKLEEEEGTGMKATDQRYPAEESQPDERFSTTVESAATTAPTLPEDERIPLDEIKEIVEEKYVKEETKEEKPVVSASATPPRLEQPTTLPQVVVAAGVGVFDPTAPHAIVHLQRDIVKTPDEVADLPVHEEVDPGTYESDEFSREFKSKDDSSKKQQESEEARGQSPEPDAKPDIHLKRDSPAEKQIDSKPVEDEKLLPLEQKEETIETIETEPEKKTEKLEAEVVKADIAMDVDKTEKLETKDIGKIEESEPQRDETCILQETEDKLVIKDEKTSQLPVTDEDKKTDIAQAVSETEKKELPEEKADILKDSMQEDKKTEVTAESKEMSKTDTEKGIIEAKEDIHEKELPEIVDDKVEKPQLEKEKKDVSEKEIAEKEDETFEFTAETTKPEISTKDVLEKEEDTKELQDSEKHLLDIGKEVTSVHPFETHEVSDKKTLPETSKVEEFKVDKESDIKQITEQFIEMESHIDDSKVLAIDKQDVQPGVSEIPKKGESDKLEKEELALEKTDEEKHIAETSEDYEKEEKPAEKEKFELEVMELQKVGKEHVESEKQGEKSEVTKSDIGYSGELSGEEYFDQEKEPSQVKTEEGDKSPEKLEEEKIQHTQDKEQPQMTEDQSQYEDEKLEKEEKESEKTDKDKVKEDEKPEAKDTTMSNLEILEQKDLLAVEKSEIKKPEEQIISEDKEGTISDIDSKSKEEEIEEVTKDSAELSILKESITSKEEKDIDEKDKVSEKLPLKLDDAEIDREIKTDHVDTDFALPEVSKETEKLEVEESPEDKPSPGALSMTYLEIIDKLQKDSQKDNESESESKELKDEPPLPLTKEQEKTDELKSTTEVTSSAEPDSIPKSTKDNENDLKPTIEKEISTTLVEEKRDDDVKPKLEELEKDISGKLQDLKEIAISKLDTEVKKAEETEKPETKSETFTEKSIQEEDLRTKPDDSNLKELPISDHLPQADETKIRHPLESDLKLDAHVSDERPSDFNETGVDSDLKLSDDRDDSYGDDSISPGEAYVDSGLEEEPVYGKLEAPEVPEYVTVTPDSAPASPKIQRDQITSQKLHEDMTKQELSEKDKYPNKDEVQHLESDKHSTMSKEEEPSDKILASKSEVEQLPVTDVTQLPEKLATSIPDTSLPSKEKTDISKMEPELEEFTPDIITGKEVGEANILDDLVSTSKSAIADIQSKLTTQVEEILSTPWKDKEEVVEKTEKVKDMSSESSGKGSTDSLEEVKHDFKDVTEENIYSKLTEDTAQDLVKKDKVDENAVKIVSTEGKSLTDTHDKTLEKKEEEKPVIKIDEDIETITDDTLVTKLHSKSLDEKDRVVSKLDEESLENKIEEDIPSSKLHDESLHKETKSMITDLKETPQDKIHPAEEKLPIELYEDSIKKEKDKSYTVSYDESLPKEKPFTVPEPPADFYTEEVEKKIFTSDDKTFSELQHKSLDRQEMLTEDRIFPGVYKIRETHITYTTGSEEEIPHVSEDIIVPKSESLITDSKSLDQKPTTSSEIVKSETIITKVPINQIQDTKDSLETSKETTVVTDISKTTVSSSDSSCMSTTTISEITSAKVIAEKESSAIMTSTIATVSSVDKEKDSIENGSLGTVHRMMVTASSEDGGTETELCPSPTPGSQDEKELPGTSSSKVAETVFRSTENIKETEQQKLDKESISKEDISKTVISSALGATNGDMNIVDDDDIDEGGETGSDEEFGSSRQISTKTTKTTTTVTRKVLEVDDDEIDPDDKENYEEITTQEIGEDGRIITKTVKTTRRFVTVTQEGEDSEDSDFEDEDNIESTAAEDGSDSSRISKTTTSFTTVTKPDDNGVRSLSTDSSDKTGDADSEVVTKTTTTTMTVTKAITGEGDDVLTSTTTTTKEFTLGDGRVIESTSTSHEVGKSEDLVTKKDDDVRSDSADSSKQIKLSKDSSPSKSAETSVVAGDTVKIDYMSKMLSSDTTKVSDKDQKPESIGKLEEEKLLNGSEHVKEAHGILDKSVLGDLDDISSTTPLHGSTKKEVEIHIATSGSDVISDHDLDTDCGPSVPHSNISSGQAARVPTSVWGRHEGHPDSRHCDSDEDDDEDEPGSPLSVTSQLAHSPPSQFDFDMGDRNTSDFDIKHSISTTVKHKEEISKPQFSSSSMTSSFYGSLPPDPLQQLLQEQKEKESQKSSVFTSESDDKYGESMISKDSAMTSSFYGSLEEKKEIHHPEPIGAERYVGHLQEDESLDFETAMYEHRAARGKDLTSPSSGYHYESSAHSSKYEHVYTPGLNGQKQKGEHSYQEFSEDYGNGNVAVGKHFEDLMNQNRGDKVNGKGTAYGDPIDHGFHSETFSKASASDTSAIGMEHDPMFHHQFAAPTTSASSFPDAPQGFSQTSKSDEKKKDPIADWGKPLGLPAPAPPPTNNSDDVLPQNTNKGTPKKEKKVMQMKKTMMMNENNKTASGGQTGKDSKSKRPESPVKQPSSERKGSSNKEGNRNLSSGKSLGNPIYIDLTYVPHHGNSYYTTLEFFKKVRARYYVFSGTEPSREVYNALLDAKQTWEDKELGNLIIFNHHIISK